MAPPSGKSAFEVRRHDRFDAVSDLWSRFQQEGTSTAFQHARWLQAVADQLSGKANEKPCFLEICDAHAGAPLMLLPLVVTTQSGCKVLTFLGHVVSDISAPLMAPGYVFPEEAGPALWDAIQAALPAADLVIIDEIPALLRHIRNPLACLPHLEAADRQSFDVAIDGEPDLVVDRLVNNQTRRILKTSQRRMSERGEIRFLVAETPEDIELLFPIMVRQRLDRFRELGRFDFLERPEIQAFYRQAALSSLDGKGPVRLFGLSVGGTWIATTYTLVHAGTIHLTIVAMADSSWHSCSPGMAIISRYIRWARQQGVTLVDFSIGELAYKVGFGGEPRDRYRLCIPLTVKGRILLAVRKKVARLKQGIKENETLSRFVRRGIQIYRNRGQSGSP